MEPGKVIEQDHPYSFRYLREDRVIHAFNDCCLTLGRHSNFSDTIDYFMDVVRQREMYDNEAVYIMAHLIKGKSCDFIYAYIMKTSLSFLIKIVMLKYSNGYFK